MRKLLADRLRGLGLFLLVVVCAAAAPVVRAQDKKGDEQKNYLTDGKSDEGATSLPGFLNRRHELTLIGGVAPNMPPRRFFDSGRHSTFGMAGLRYARRLGAKKYILLKYTVDFAPAAFIRYDQIRSVENSPGVFTTERRVKTVYAASLMPAGIQLNFRRARKLQPFVAANVGATYFSEPVPDDSSALRPDQKGKRMNIVFGVDGGVEFQRESGKSYIVGFKFQHISNISTGKINPGFNQNFLYFGYTFKKW